MALRVKREAFMISSLVLYRPGATLACAPVDENLPRQAIELAAAGL